MSSQLRDFFFESTVIDKLDQNCLQFYKSPLLKRSTIKTSILDSLKNLENQIKLTRDKHNDRPYRCEEFGDVRMRANDPSVQIALFEVGKKLITKQCLSINEITYYFVRGRYNFLKNLNVSINTTENLQFHRILNQLEECTSIITVETDEFGNDNLIFNERKNNLTIRTLMKTAERYVFNYFSLVIVPKPSILGN